MHLRLLEMDGQHSATLGRDKKINAGQTTAWKPRTATAANAPGLTFGWTGLGAPRDEWRRFRLPCLPRGVRHHPSVTVDQVRSVGPDRGWISPGCPIDDMEK